MALSGFLFIYIIIAINYWIRDVIREYTKKYEVLIIMLFIVFLVFVFSEFIMITPSIICDRKSGQQQQIREDV